MHRRSFSWVALVGIGLAGVVAVSAATALAARSTASPFELVAIDRFEPACPDCDPWTTGHYVGTFTSGAPFCATGTHVELDIEAKQRFTCDDGTGSLTVSIGHRNADWQILDGSGSYAGLRGRGSLLTEYLGGEFGPWLSTFEGAVDWDAVAPSVAFTSPSATKLPRLSRAYSTPVYSMRVGLSLRDDVEGNTVAYKLEVTGRRGIGLYSEDGTTASGSVSTTFRVVPPSKRARSVQLQLTGSDPVGNEVSITRSLKLPRS